jgi:three-Cys-motif partner protein
MPGKDDTLWDLEDHSRAKHEILKTYLFAWLPIMSKWNGRLVLVDGFAGPGRYKGGEDGSPLIMLKAFLEHDHRSKIDAELIYLFIEERTDRIAHLEKEIECLKLPNQVKVEVVNGVFEEEFRDLLDDVQRREANLAPTFAFIDPFGYTDASMDLAGEFLQFERCEILVYMPLPYVVRFVGRKGQEGAMTSLFGSEDAWRPAIDLKGEERKAFLHDLFRDQLKMVGGVKYVRSFEIITKSGTGGYHLFFGTDHEKGLERMKSAMWRIDPQEGRQFRDSTVSAQLVLLAEDPDLQPLQDAFEKHFGKKAFSIQEAERFALIDTSFLPSHVRSVLKPLEEDGRLQVLTPRKMKRTYPAGTKMRIVS